MTVDVVKEPLELRGAFSGIEDDGARHDIESSGLHPDESLIDRMMRIDIHAYEGCRDERAARSPIWVFPEL
jgi:hypothetical protein